MEEQQNPLTYEIIKAAVAGEKWATEKVIAHYDSYIEELATVKEKRPDGSVRTFVDEDLKQEIALKLLEKIPDFPLEEAERVAEEETDKGI
ncbi:helix-turn-helix domain-containing protein [Lachnospiraceae bacterium HCP28S3_F9]